jgi:hypothetical protein
MVPKTAHVNFDAPVAAVVAHLFIPVSDLNEGPKRTKGPKTAFFWLPRKFASVHLVPWTEIEKSATLVPWGILRAFQRTHHFFCGIKPEGQSRGLNENPIWGISIQLPF